MKFYAFNFFLLILLDLRNDLHVTSFSQKNQTAAWL